MVAVKAAKLFVSDNDLEMTALEAKWFEAVTEKLDAFETYLAKIEEAQRGSGITNPRNAKDEMFGLYQQFSNVVEDFYRVLDREAKGRYSSAAVAAEFRYLDIMRDEHHEMTLRYADELFQLGKREKPVTARNMILLGERYQQFTSGTEGSAGGGSVSLQDALYEPMKHFPMKPETVTASLSPQFIQLGSQFLLKPATIPV